jgi:hypothetical protein
VSVTLVALWASAAAQTPPRLVVNNGDIVFRALLDRKQDPLQPKIGNGDVLNTKEWPATVEADSDGIPCTGTLLGPEVLLTAAHCVGDDKIATIKFDDKSTVSGKCARHPDWSESNRSPDFALCRMTTIDRKGLLFEHLVLDASSITVGSRLFIVGYGCIDLTKQTRDGLLRGGGTAIKSLPVTAGIWPHWLLTERADESGGSFACPGDSGGAAYIVRSDKSRRVVAVLSAVGDISSEPDYTTSYLSTTGSGALASFLSTWRKEGKPLVCGLPPNPPKCRPTPP